MAIPFLPIAIALAAAGDVLGGFQRAQAIGAEKNRLKVQARLASADEAEASAERMRRLRQVLAANVASAAGAGFDPGSASVLAIGADAAGQTGRAIDLDRARTAAETSALRSAAGVLSPSAAILGGLVSGGSRLLPLLAERRDPAAELPDIVQPTTPAASLSPLALARRRERLFGRV